MGGIVEKCGSDETRGDNNPFSCIEIFDELWGRGDNSVGSRSLERVTRLAGRGGGGGSSGGIYHCSFALDEVGTTFCGIEISCGDTYPEQIGVP